VTFKAMHEGPIGGNGSLPILLHTCGNDWTVRHGHITVNGIHDPRLVASIHFYDTRINNFKGSTSGLPGSAERTLESWFPAARRIRRGSIKTESA
jgi:hypothetical protein